MIIQNAQAFLPDHTFRKKDIRIENERISEIADKLMPGDGEEVIDAKGSRVIPGLVDIHLHGAMRQDFCNAGESLDSIVQYELQNGIVAICATTMSLDEKTLTECVERIFAHRNNRGAEIVGINLEGPFISVEKCGAQDPKNIIPASSERFRRLNRASGNRIKFVDLAPETEGAMAFIEACKDETVISVAHTMCDYETAQEAFRKGACHVTHLFNCMPGITHRKPGPIMAAAEAGADAELISDGIHVHPAMIRLAFSLFGPEHMILISDSMEATGLSDGTYSLGGQAVTVSGNKATLATDENTIAGSVTNLFDCMKYAVTVANIPAADAIVAATENPAKSAGVIGDYGRIAVGTYGSLLVIDENMNLKQVIHKGNCI